jgi:hypothetical protein
VLPPAVEHVLLDQAGKLRLLSDKFPTGVDEVVLTVTVNVAVFVPELS